MAERACSRAWWEQRDDRGSPPHQAPRDEEDGRADEADDISSVMRALEDKRLLLRLLDELASEDGSQVIFGEETESDTLRACAVVSAPYRVGGRCLGAVAVVGPVRMNYARIIPWVEYTAEAISGILHTGRAA